MFVPSIAPNAWGKPQRWSKPSTVSRKCCCWGTVMYRGSRWPAIIWQVSSTISQTVERPSPKRVAIVRYSVLVASLHTVTATLTCTLIGSRNLVTCRSIWGLSSLHTVRKVSIEIVKFSCHHCSPHSPASTLCHHPLFRSLHQTVRPGFHLPSTHTSTILHKQTKVLRWILTK